MPLSLDADKAFDRMAWIYLHHTLIDMGFRDNFVKWITLLYQDPWGGMRQGNVLSTVLFALSIEPLAEAIWQNLSNHDWTYDSLIVWVTYYCYTKCPVLDACTCKLSSQIPSNLRLQIFIFSIFFNCIFIWSGHVNTSA